MTHQPYNYSAFICYASADGDKASQVCQVLEDRGLKCWIAPRDVRPGAEFADEIIRGIEASRCVVLLLSEAANHSKYVRRETERAVNKGRPIYPIRLEEILPSPSLELFVSSTQWIDAWTGELTERVEKLCGVLASGGPDEEPAATPAPSETPVAAPAPPAASSSDAVPAAAPDPAQAAAPPPVARAPARNEGRQGGNMGLMLSLVGLFVILLLVGGGVGFYALFNSDSDQDSDLPPQPFSVVPGAPEPLAVPIDMTDEELLIKLLAAIDAEDYTAVTRYAEEFFGDRRDLEIENYRGRLQAPMIAAVREGDMDLLFALTSARPLFGLEDQRGREPIHVAAAEGHPAVVEFFINEIGVSPDDKSDGTGYTAMHWAALEGQGGVIAKLAELEADPNALTKTGRTPLHLAVEKQQLLAVKALVKLTEIDINATDARGQTPLHVAATQGSEVIADLLLTAGADTTVKDLDGKTPGDLAYDAAHDALAEKLGASAEKS